MVGTSRSFSLLLFIPRRRSTWCRARLRTVIIRQATNNQNSKNYNSNPEFRMFTHSLFCHIQQKKTRFKYLALEIKIQSLPCQSLHHCPLALQELSCLVQKKNIHFSHCPIPSS